MIIYKGFVRSYLDNGDLAYNKADNKAFHQKLESAQYNACQAHVGAIRRSSRERIYQKLSLESL